MSYVTLPSVRVACSSHRPALTLARCSVAAHCASLRVLATPALRASAARKLVCSSPLCPQFAIVALPRYRLQVSRLSVQHGRSASFASSLAALPASLGSSAAIAPSIRNGRPAAPYGLQYSLAHWAYYGLFPPQAAAFVRPSPVSAEILWISGRGNCKEAIFALENGIFRRKNRPVPAVHAAGDD